MTISFGNFRFAGPSGRRRITGMAAALLILLQLVLPCAMPTAWADPALEGEGTQANPYKISNAEELMAIADDPGAYYELTGNIDLSGHVPWNPLGTFNGHLEGNGHKITGLMVNTTGDHAGLFANIGSDGVVQNLVLENVSVIANGLYSNAGALAGMLQGSVSNVRVSGGSVSGIAYLAGGLVGSMFTGAQISKSCSQIQTESQETLSNVGGLVGYLTGGTISESCVTGPVTGEFAVGGLAGYALNASIVDSYATGTVTGSYVAGGLIGMTAGPVSLERVYAAGAVTGGMTVTGALVGMKSTDDDVSAEDAYYDEDATGQSDADGTALSSEEMGDESSFNNWDFDTLWHMDARNGRPTFLRDDSLAPVMSGAVVSNDEPGKVVVDFSEKILADDEALIRFSVSVDGTEVDIEDARLGTDGKQLVLTLEESVEYGQEVKVSYSASAPPVTDKAGNPMASHEIEAENEVEEPNDSDPSDSNPSDPDPTNLEVVSVSPEDNATGVAGVTQLSIRFNQPVEAAAGKFIYIMNEKGTVAEQIGANSPKVQVDDKTVTIRLNAELAPLTNFYVIVEAGAFETAEGDAFGGIYNPADWNFTTAADPDANWVNAGNPGFTAGGAEYPDLKAGKDGTLYVVFRDYAHDGKATAMKLGPSDSAWSLVGEAGFSPGEIGAPSLVVDGSTLYVAFAAVDEDDLAAIYVLQYALNGSGEWEPAGERIPVGTLEPSLLLDQDPQPFLHVYLGELYVAYRDGFPWGGLTVRKLAEGGVWEWVGQAEFSPGDIFDPTLVTFEDLLYAGFHDYDFIGHFSATAMRYDAMSEEWKPAGERGITSSEVFYPTLVTDGTRLYFVYSNNAYQAAAMGYSSETNIWYGIGGGAFSTGQAYGTTAWAGDGALYAAFTDEGHGNKLVVKKYAGSSWVSVGNDGFTPDEAYNPSLVVFNSLSGNVPYVAFEDANREGKLTVMKFGTFNQPPVAKNVGIEGDLKTGETVEGTYTFTDAEGDEEGESLYQWYTADNEEGGNKTAIAGATDLELDLTLDLLDKYLIFEVTPVAETGTRKGAKVSSAPQGPVTKPDAPPAPNVTADDTLNVIVGADETMEYSTDGGATYTPYDPAHPPVFAGNVTVLVRVKANETTGAPVGAAKTLTFTANPAPAPSPAPSPAPAPTPTVTEEPAGTGDTGVTVLINGKEESAGTASTSARNGQSVTTIAVDPAKVEAKLAEEGMNAVLTIPAPSGSNVVVGELNGRIVKSMEDRQAVLEIVTDRATYTIPAEQFDIGAISEELGASGALEDITIRVEIGEPPEATVEVIENAAEDDTYAIVVPPVEFTVRAEYDGQTVEITKFTAYVERAIAVPDGVDPDRITTGVVFDADGTPRHVPTKIVVINGKYCAVVSSLTNSAYGVVWNPVEFDDVASHWAKDTVNNMGSRMIIAGTGNGKFSPDRDITRAEFAAIIVRALGLGAQDGPSAFTDVKASDWFNGAIRTAVEYGLLSGYADGAFRPNDKITREQAMVILARAMAVTGLKDRLPGGLAEEVVGAFADAGQASAWSVQGIADSVAAGIVQGRNENTLAPQAFITRAEAAAMIERLLQKSDLI